MRGVEEDSSILNKPSKVEVKYTTPLYVIKAKEIKSSLCSGTLGVISLFVLISIIETPCSVPT